MDQSHCETGMRLRPIQTKFEKRGSTNSNGESDHHHHKMNGGGADLDDQDQPLSPAGQLFLEPNFNIHVLAMMGFKTKIDTAVVKANLPHTLLKHPRFCGLPVRPLPITLTYHIARNNTELLQVYIY